MPATLIRGETQIILDSIFDAQIAPTAAIQLSKILLSGNLAAVQALSSTGIVVQTGAGTFADRTLVAPVAGIGISNANGVSGNPTFVLQNDLGALEGLASTGIAVRTASDTWAQRTVAGTTNRITVTNGSGVSGDPTIDISSAYVGQATITTLGTITTGTWNGTAVAIANGGTGQTTASAAFNALSPLTTKGDLLVYTTTNTRLAVGTNGFALLADSTQASGVRWGTIASALQLYAENPSSPTTPSATGTNAIALNSGTVAAANLSIAAGSQSNSRFLGSLALASGNFSAAGDAQQHLLTMRNITTNATTTSLFLDGSSARLVMPNNSAWTFQISVVGRRTDATGGHAGYTFSGTIRRDATAGTTTFTGGRTKVIEGETDGAWDAEVVADTTNGALDIQVNGQAGKTIRWAASVWIIEVVN